MTLASRLVEALDAIPAAAWSRPSNIETTGAHHGYRRLVLADNRRPQGPAPSFAFVLDLFAPVHTAWLSWIVPGGYIVTHRDAGPYRERWQIPILAGNMDGLPCEPARPFRVEHWRPHSVAPVATDRVHLVIDRDVLLDHTALPFTILEEAS